MIIVGSCIRDHSKSGEGYIHSLYCKVAKRLTRRVGQFSRAEWDAEVAKDIDKAVMRITRAWYAAHGRPCSSKTVASMVARNLVCERQLVAERIRVLIRKGKLVKGHPSYQISPSGK